MKFNFCFTSCSVFLVVLLFIGIECQPGMYNYYRQYACQSNIQTDCELFGRYFKRSMSFDAPYKILKDIRTDGLKTFCRDVAKTVSCMQRHLRMDGNCTADWVPKDMVEKNEDLLAKAEIFHQEVCVSKFSGFEKALDCLSPENKVKELYKSVGNCVVQRFTVCYVNTRDDNGWKQRRRDEIQHDLNCLAQGIEDQCGLAAKVLVTRTAILILTTDQNCSSHHGADRHRFNRQFENLAACAVPIVLPYVDMVEQFNRPQTMLKQIGTIGLKKICSDAAEFALCLPKFYQHTKELVELNISVASRDQELYLQVLESLRQEVCNGAHKLGFEKVFNCLTADKNVDATLQGASECVRKSIGNSNCKSLEQLIDCASTNIKSMCGNNGDVKTAFIRAIKPFTEEVMGCSENGRPGKLIDMFRNMFF